MFSGSALQSWNQAVSPISSHHQICPTNPPHSGESGRITGSLAGSTTPPLSFTLPPTATEQTEFACLVPLARVGWKWVGRGWWVVETTANLSFSFTHTHHLNCTFRVSYTQVNPNTLKQEQTRPCLPSPNSQNRI